MNSKDTPTQSEIEATVAQVLARALDMDPSDIKMGANLEQEYGAESLDFLEIIFALEKAFHVRMPRISLLQQAEEHFGEGALVLNGQLTELGARMLRQMRPEIDPSLFRPGLRIEEATRLVTPQTFVRLVLQLLEAKREARLQLQAAGCETCGSKDIQDSNVAPEFVCGNCGAAFPLVGGDEVLMKNLLSLKSTDGQ